MRASSPSPYLRVVKRTEGRGVGGRMSNHDSRITNAFFLRRNRGGGGGRVASKSEGRNGDL